MLTLKTTGFAEQTLQKSHFLAWATPIGAETDSASFLRAIAAQHATASHLAYAYRVKTAAGLVARFSDAGEPSGTAGKPILQMLEGRDLVNCCVGVIRYYGGINLGTGGLARAYSGTAKLALAAAEVATYVEMQVLELTIAYNRLDELTKVVTQINGKMLNKIFDQAVHVQIVVPKTQQEALVARFGQYAY